MGRSTPSVIGCWLSLDGMSRSEYAGRRPPPRPACSRRLAVCMRVCAAVCVWCVQVCGGTGALTRCRQLRRPPRAEMGQWRGTGRCGRRRRRSRAGAAPSARQLPAHRWRAGQQNRTLSYQNSGYCHTRTAEHLSEYQDTVISGQQDIVISCQHEKLSCLMSGYQGTVISRRQDTGMSSQKDTVIL